MDSSGFPIMAVEESVSGHLIAGETDSPTRGLEPQFEQPQVGSVLEEFEDPARLETRLTDIKELLERHGIACTQHLWELRLSEDELLPYKMLANEIALLESIPGEVRLRMVFNTPGVLQIWHQTDGRTSRHGPYFEVVSDVEGAPHVIISARLYSPGQLEETAQVATPGDVFVCYVPVRKAFVVSSIGSLRQRDDPQLILHPEEISSIEIL